MTKYFSTPVAIGILAIAALALAMVMPRPASADSHDTVPAELVAAMDQWIADQGQESAGACADTDVDTDIGDWCWQVESMTETRAVAAFGPTFSEFTDRVTFELQDGAWVVTSEEGIPPVGDPPGVGTGLASSGGFSTAQMVLAAGVVLMLAGGAGFAATRSRNQS